MPDTVLIRAGVAVLVARAPCDQTSFGAAELETGEVVTVPDNTAAPGMLWDAETQTLSPPPED